MWWMGTLPKESNVKLKEVLSQGRSVHSPSLLRSSHPRWQRLVKEQVGAAWPQLMPRGSGHILLSKCPAYTQTALPEPWTGCSVPERHMTEPCISLLRKAGISSFPYVEWRWTGPEHIMFSLFSKRMSVLHHQYKHVIAICRKQTWGYFCHISCEKVRS